MQGRPWQQQQALKQQCTKLPIITICLRCWYINSNAQVSFDRTSDSINLPSYYRQPFPVSSTDIWNYLPPNITSAPSIVFKRASGSIWRYFCSVIHILTSSYDKLNTDVDLAMVCYLWHVKSAYDDDDICTHVRKHQPHVNGLSVNTGLLQ